jgi:hypothetical protein
MQLKPLLSNDSHIKIIGHSKEIIGESDGSKANETFIMESGIPILLWNLPVQPII